MDHPISSMPLLLFFTLLIAFPCFSSSATVHPYHCYQDDQNVLLQIKNYFNNSTLFASWLPGTDCCRWSGINCKKIPKTTTYRVIFLEIQGADDIVGTIPPLIADLPYLDTLIFRHLPNLTGQIPPAIGKLTQLSMLQLNWNSLTGPIPNYFSNLKLLAALELNDNQLTGTIPSYLGQLPSLTYLILTNNQLSGTIPSSLGQFPMARNINLANNQLTGRIPASFGSLADSSLLLLKNNKLSGPIPKSLANVDFEMVDFSGNRLTGDAYMFFGENKTTITGIKLANNRLSFDFTNVTMPKSMNSLLYLDLSQNMIYGRLPEWIGEAPDLMFLNVSYNQLCGPIPTPASAPGFNPFVSSSFEHNKCLCGAPLPPCMSP